MSALPIQSVTATQVLQPSLVQTQRVVPQPIQQVQPIQTMGLNPYATTTGRPRVYSASTYRPTMGRIGRNIPAYGAINAPRNNMILPMGYTTRTYNARRL